MELSFGEILLVGVIAFLVLGPEEMVRRSRQFGRFMGKIRSQFNNLKVLAEEELVRKDELQNIKQSLKSIEERSKQMNESDIEHRLATIGQAIQDTAKKDPNEQS